MPYLNIDDAMDEHPKIEPLSDAAFRLHVSAMLYAARRGTDGAIPLSKSRRLSDTASDGVAMELVNAGVWHDLGDGCDDSRTCLPGQKGQYIIHDYLQWNHSKAWWDQRSEDAAARGSKAMHRRWHTRRDVFREDCKHCQEDRRGNANNNGGYNGANNGVDNKPITEPDTRGQIPEPESIPVSSAPSLALVADESRPKAVDARGGER